MKATFKSLTEVKAANKQLGHCWFSPAAMKFFKSKVVSKLMFGQYFISSECYMFGKSGTPEVKFTIRKAWPSGQIETIGGGETYKSKQDAIDALHKLLGLPEEPQGFFGEQANG